MGTTMSEWRQARSTCAGALVWFLRDLWEGAGWGLIDSRGCPKAPYYYLKRVLSPLALLVTDEGLNGVSLHAVNDRGDAIAATLSVTMYRGEHVVARGERAITLEAHSVTELKVDAVIGRFTDVAYAYRFGPPNHDVTVATLTDTQGALLARAFHFPRGLRDDRVSDVGMEASAARVSDRAWRVVVRTRNVAQAVAFDARGFIAADDFFHVAPGTTHEVVLTSQQAHGGPLSATVKPVNATTATRIVCA
jgi:beta-mannosidase